MTAPLSETDLSILVTLLHNAASKWRRIGDALAFTDGELSSIAGIPLLLNKGDEGFLRELLTRWLKWAPPQHQLPTIAALAQALRTVGEERKAYDLPQKFQQRKQQQNGNQGIGQIGGVGAGIDSGAVGGKGTRDLKMAGSSVVLAPRDCKWYHGRISEDIAKGRLMSASTDCFLVRNSVSRPGNYTLSMKHKAEFKQFQIDVHVTSGSYEVQGTEKSFGSLGELVHYYKKCPLSADGEVLLTPCESAQEDNPASQIMLLLENLLKEIRSLKLKGQGMKQMEDEVDRLRQFEQQVKELQTQLEEAQQKEQTNDDQIRALEEHHRAKEKELHTPAVFPNDHPEEIDHSTEVASLKKQLEEKSQKLHNLEAQLQALGYEKVAHEREQLQRHIKKQSEEMKKLKQELEACAAKAALWKQDFEAERHEREKAARKREDEQAQTHVVLQKLREELKQCHAEIAAYKAEIREKSKLGKKLEACQTERKTEVQRYKTQAGKKSKIEEKYESCQAELQQCRADLEYHQRQLREHQEQLDDMEKLFQAQQTSHLETLNDMKAQQISHSETQKELKEARQTLEGSLKGSSDLHDEVLAKTQQVKQYKKQADQYKTQLEELKMQQLAAQSQSQQAVGQCKVEGLLQERDTLYAQIHDLTTRMGGGGQVPGAQSAQYEALRRKYDELMDKYDRLFQQNEQLQELLRQRNILHVAPPSRQDQSIPAGTASDVFRAKIEQPQVVVRSSKDPQQRQLGGGPTYPMRGPQQMGIPHSPHAPQKPYQPTPQYQQPVTPQYPHHSSPIYKDGSQSAFQQRMQGDMSQIPQLFPSQHQQQEEAYWRQQQQQPFRMRAHSVDDPCYLQHPGTNAAGGHYRLGQAQTQAPMHPNVQEVPGNYGYPQGYEDPGRPAFHPPCPIRRKSAPQIVSPDDSLETGLMKNLGGEIHQAAADVEANIEEASYPPVTQEHIPFDPNLVCPYCSKQFRIGQIQEFKRHVQACKGSSYPPITQEHIPFDPNLVCPYCSKQFRIGQIQKFKRHVNACTGT